MPTYTTYDTVGIKEDISDVISNLSPTKTPFVSLIGKDSTKSRTFQWMEDSLAAAAANAQIEGADSTDMTLAAPVMRSNTTQILSKAFKISATEDAVDQYGRAKETAYQTVKVGAELKRDLELNLIGVSQALVVGTSGAARKTASANQMVAAGLITAGGTAALTEAKILTAAQTAFTAGADPSFLMIKPADALIVAGFTGASGRYREITGDSRKLVNVVDLYVSPFGEYKVVLNRFQLTAEAWLLDPSMWKLVTLRPWTREPLAKVGDADRTLIVGEFGLKNTNYSSSALINALT
jgi:hypothetical protein